jgi:hypothetical protein
MKERKSNGVSVKGIDITKNDEIYQVRHVFSAFIQSTALFKRFQPAQTIEYVTFWSEVVSKFPNNAPSMSTLKTLNK